MSPDSTSWLTLIHGLATCLVEWGLYDLADSLLRRHQRLYKRAGNWLVDQMLRSFQAKGIAREAYASLVLLRKSCEQRRSAEVLCVQIEALAKLLPELDAPGRGKFAKGVKTS